MHKKIRVSIILTVLAVLAMSTLLFACGDDEPKTVVITAETSADSLKAYMDTMQENGKLTYKLENGMVTELNGKKNETNKYWMLYTNDTENANSECGTFTYDGKTYASAAVGAESLPVKEGYVYIWTYQSFGV